MSARVILITGANGGLGQAIARAFLQESSANLVWLGVRSRREHADQLAREYQDRCFILALDVTDPAVLEAGGCPSPGAPWAAGCAGQ